MEKKVLSVFDVCYEIVKTIPKEHITKELKKSLLGDIKELLSKGWIAEHILKTVLSSKINFSKANSKIIPLFNEKVPSVKNILKQNIFYLHNQLRISSKPAQIDFDLNTGEFKKVVEDYFLELRADFTMDELIEYYFKHTNLYENKSKSLIRAKGALAWLVEKYSLEQVLFMIDEADNHIQSCNLPKLKNILDVQDYYAAAKETYQRRYTECRYNGVDKIVPRKRNV